MKLLTPIFLLIAFTAFAQRGNIFTIDSLPTEGVLLDKGWKWHEGDNPDFAKVDFDDSAWESIDPTQDIMALPQISKNGQIGWFRLTLLMDESLLKKQISLVIQQTGASEIYLNGSKIATNGVINLPEIIAKDPLWKPFPINLNNQKQQVLAVRFALQPNLLYTAIFENYNPAIWINVMDSAVGVEFHYSVTSRNLIFIFLIIGISFMIFVIHFSFYVLYPSQKANLYFSLFSLFFLLGSLSQYFYWLQPFQVSYKFYLGNLAFLLFIIAYVNLLTAAYLFLEKKRDFFYYFLAIFSVIAVFLNAYPYGIGWKLGGPMQELFIQINIARIAVTAVRKKQKGSWIIAVGAFSTLIFFVIFLSQGTFTNASFLLSLPLKRMIFYNFFVLSLPISTSLFLAFQFSKINEDIQLQLIENQNLADEKQQILATQNETLEKQVTERTAELVHKNRDLEIEAALEKVRSRTMAMQKSDELGEAATLLFKQVSELGIKAWTTGFNVWTDDNNFYTDYISSPQGNIIKAYKIDATQFSVFVEVSDAKKRGDEFLVQYVEGDLLKQTYLELAKFGDEKQYEIMLQDGFQFPSHQYDHFVFGSKVSLMFITYEAVPEAHDIFIRFGKIFEQTYTRFLDLQKAEAQTREAKIEVALEKVRSRAMAMQKSEELSLLIGCVYTELMKLDVLLDRCLFMIFDPKTLGVTWWMGSQEDTSDSRGYYLPYHEHPPYLAYLKGWQERKEKWQYILGGEEKRIWDEFVFAETELSNLPEFIINNMKAVKTSYQLASFQNFGGLITGSLQPLNDESLDILRRFAKVFDLSYTRFNDLKQAEAQAREAQIEVALEKIRSRSLAMHRSDELKEVMVIMFEKMKELDVIRDGGIGIQLFTEGSKDSVLWVATSFEINYPYCNWLPYDENIFSVGSYVTEIFKAKEEGRDVFNKIHPFEEKNRYFNYVFANNDFEVIPAHVRDFIRTSKSYTFSMAIEKNSSVVVDSWTEQFMTEPEFVILKRLARVFEQAYIRFLDLQKAEEQAREAKIETALERVRSRTMAMQKSEELRDVTSILYDQLKNLGFNNGASAIILMDATTGDMDWWLEGSDYGFTFLERYHVKYFNHKSHIEQLENWKSGASYAIVKVSGEEKKAYDKYYFNDTDFIRVPEETKELMMQAETVVFSMAYFLYGSLSWSPSSISDEQAKILQRFAKVFEQTYTRFLDLQKAEAQAREAQIEVALERVRSRTMAMQRSEELGETAKLLFQQVQTLGIPAWSCGYNIWEKDEKVCTGWMSSNGILQPPFKIPLTESPSFIRQYESKQKGEDFYIEEASGEALAAHYQYMGSLPDFGEILKDFLKSGFTLPDFQINHIVNFKQGNMVFITGEPVPEAWDIFKRFAKVFEQTYTRFLDLQKAEAQTREAKIETALEKIRSRSLGMHNSVEIKEVVSILFEKLKELNLEFDGGAAIHLFTEGSRNAVIWVAAPDLSETSCINLPYDENGFENNPIITDIWNAKETGVHIYNKFYAFEEKNRYFDYVFKHNDFKTIPQSSREFIVQADSYTASFIAEKNSLLGANSWTRQQFSENDFEVLKRIARVFEQAYIRFLDLQKAEAQAREAQIEAAFERIRGSALAMQTSDEFLGVVKTLYEQINTLGQQELEATIIQFYHIEQGFINSWNALNTEGLTTGNITSGTTRIPFDACRLTLEWLNAYKSTQEDYTIVAKGEILKEWLLLLLKMSPEVKIRFGDSLPQISHYHFSKFSEGALSMVSQKPFSEESKYLLKRAASAFDLAYKRYLDLQLKEEQSLKLAQEKQRLEAALTDLKATQAQLIQKEKLASLGELTAGIAHEIQNPLNFVNNFSELSVDLAKDLNDEIHKPDIDKEYVEELLTDLTSNQEKINHHGKRASSIVKGMLEHSRASTGVKEWTDINKLADEYLRLSYHGLRAKDKEFNADFKTEFDENLPKIEVIPQDIGRVLLNLINNAFYAVNQRKHDVIARNEAISSYTPSVFVSTQQLDNQIIIKVKDNGIGMSEATKAKVFQPFFTTKPTGQGTGLGLSLAYDIVMKGHGGTLEVESTEGVGSEFIFHLPIA